MSKSGPKPINIPKAILVELYTDRKLTVRQLAQKFHCAPSVISSRLKLYNVSTKLGPREARDLSGQTFGNWKVIERHRDTENRVKFLCECLKCNSEHVVLAQNLVAGESKQCAKCRRDELWKGHKDISKIFWNSIIRSARIRNIPFNITIEEVWNVYESQNGLCKLSGVPIILCANRKKRTASLDRIDSNGYYDVLNIQWVHKHVNSMKLDFAQEYFIEMCGKIYETQRSQTSEKIQ